MIVLFLTYIALTFYFVFQSSRKGTLYLFSPLVTVYLTFVFANIYPLVICEKEIPRSVTHVTVITCVVHFLFLFLYKHQWNSFIRLDQPSELRKIRYVKNRKYVCVIFVALIIMSGFMSGVTPTLLAGGDVENLRRTSEIGLGYIQNLPLLGLPILLLYYLLSKKSISIIQAGVIALSVGLVVFFATASRRGIAIYLILFLIWFNYVYRNFRWYEYFLIFYLIQPIIATTLSLIRSAQSVSLDDITLFAQEVMVFNANTLKLAEWFERGKIYLLGYSFYYDLVSIIPRFLWPSKPVSIDYYYKEAVGFDFDGGGIYTTRDYDLYMNFGYYYVIPYILWLLIIHKMYSCIINNDSTYSTRIFFVVTFVSGFAIGALITRIEVYVLFLIVFYLLNKKWKVV